jgi:hypothetical protein
MTKSDRNSIVLTGRSATSFIAKSLKPDSAVCARTNQYLKHVSNTTTVTQYGGIIEIHSNGKRFDPK